MRFISRIDNTFSPVVRSKFNFFRLYQMVCIGQPADMQKDNKLKKKEMGLRHRLLYRQEELHKV